MKYKLHTSPNSKDIKRIIIVFPGMDDGMEGGKPTTSNNIDKYDIFSKFTAEMSEPGVAVITTEYTGPHAWGTPIDFNTLTANIEETLKDAITELKERSFAIKVERVDLGSHSYGFTALFWSLANDILSRVIGEGYKGGTNLHLFEPYGIAAMKSAKENSLALREYDVVTAAQQRFFGIANNENSALAAESELTQLRAFDSHFQIKSLSIILGLFRPSKSIHGSYGEINAEENGVNVTKLDKVGHGGAFLDILKAQQSKTPAPDYALVGFQTLMNAWISSLRGIHPNDVTEMAVNARITIQKWIEKLCISEELMTEPKVEMTQKTGPAQKLNVKT